MTNIIFLFVACALGGYLIGIFIGTKRAFKAEDRADRYLFAVLDVDRWCGQPFPAARIIARHLKAIGEGLPLNAGASGSRACLSGWSRLLLAATRLLSAGVGWRSQI